MRLKHNITRLITNWQADRRDQHWLIEQLEELSDPTFLDRASK